MYLRHSVGNEKYSDLRNAPQGVGLHDMSYFQGNPLHERDPTVERIGHLKVGSQPRALPASVIVGEREADCVLADMAVSIGGKHFEPQL